MKEQFEITPEYNGERVDVILSSLTGKTRSNIGHLIEQGLVYIDGKAVSKSGQKVKSGSVVSYDEPEL